MAGAGEQLLRLKLLQEFEEMVLEIEGQERPACIAEVIMMAFP
nr:K815 [uncultured bacterium]